MSANDTPTEVNDNLGYVSPNISSGDEEEQKEEELDEAALEQKKRETVQLDGIPIDEKDIKFKATEIKRKADISYFVNVAEEPEEAPADPKKTADGKPAGEKKPFDFKNIAAMIKKPAAAKSEDQPKEKVDIVAQLKTIFIDGWHKYITIGVAAVILIIIGCMIIIPIIEKNSSGADDDPGAGEVKIYDNPFDRLEDTEAMDAFLNYDFETVDRIYKEVEEDLKSDDDIAKLYLDKAKRILDADATEVDRIYEAADIAYRKGSDNPEIVKELYIIYGLLGDKEKADEMNDTLIELGVDVDEDDDDDKKDDTEKKDAEKKDDSKKDDDKSKDTDDKKESDKKAKSDE